jgi:hypothetical protein
LPTTIKRYPNRKLYDMAARRYITLDGVAQLLRQGVEISVVDHVSGEDLTAVTLSQIVLAQEKGVAEARPSRAERRPDAARSSSAGGDALDMLRQMIASPFDLVRQVDEEIRRRVEALIGQSEIGPEDGRRLLEKLMNFGRGLTSPADLVEPLVSRALAASGIPTRDDLRRLEAQIDALNARLDELISDKDKTGR